MRNANTNGRAPAWFCTICGLHYESEELSKECYRWCSKHKSCNLAIARQSFEARGKQGGD